MVERPAARLRSRSTPRPRARGRAIRRRRAWSTSTSPSTAGSWRRTVRADRRALAGRTILAVFAHPDDESLACGGTLARAGRRGRARRAPVRVARRAGIDQRPVARARRRSGPRPRARTARRRRDPRHRRGDRCSITPTAICAGRTCRSCTPRSWSPIDRYRPDAVITFGEDGLYWHLDHIGVHERTYTAVQSFGAAAPPLYYVTMPQGAMREVVEAAHARGGAPPDSSFWGIAPDAFGDAAKPPDFVVDVRDVDGAQAGRAALPSDADGPPQPDLLDRRGRRAPPGSASSASDARRSRPPAPPCSSSSATRSRCV